MEHIQSDRNARRYTTGRGTLVKRGRRRPRVKREETECQAFEMVYPRGYGARLGEVLSAGYEREEEGDEQEDGLQTRNPNSDITWLPFLDRGS